MPGVGDFPDGGRGGGGIGGPVPDSARLTALVVGVRPVSAATPEAAGDSGVRAGRWKRIWGRSGSRT